jgi:hypothetical protein
MDVQRTPWFDAFFSAWSFESPEDLLAAVRSTTVDLERMARNRDLSGQGLSGWTYWYLYLKGYTQYVEADAVADSNIYYRYLTEYFEQDEGLAPVLRDREAARIRVARRYEDFGALAASPEERPGFEPITIWTQEPAPIDAKLVFVEGSSAPFPAVDIDGYHRLFAARLHGLERVPAEVIDKGQTGAQRELLKRMREIERAWRIHLDEILYPQSDAAGGPSPAEALDRPDLELGAPPDFRFEPGPPRRSRGQLVQDEDDQRPHADRHEDSDRETQRRADPWQ